MVNVASQKEVVLMRWSLRLQIGRGGNGGLDSVGSSFGVADSHISALIGPSSGRR